MKSKPNKKEKIKLANDWFKLMEDKSYTKYDVFIAGYEKGLAKDIQNRIDLLNELLSVCISDEIILKRDELEQLKSELETLA